MNRNLKEAYRRILENKIDIQRLFEAEQPPPDGGIIGTEMDSPVPTYRSRDWIDTTIDIDPTQYYAGIGTLGPDQQHGDEYYSPAQNPNDFYNSPFYRYEDGPLPPGPLVPGSNPPEYQEAPPGYRYVPIGPMGQPPNQYYFYELYNEVTGGRVSWEEIHRFRLPVRDREGHYSPQYDGGDPSVAPYFPPGGYNDPRTHEYPATPAGLQQFLKDLEMFLWQMYGYGHVPGQPGGFLRGPYGTGGRNLRIFQNPDGTYSYEFHPGSGNPLQRWLERIVPGFREWLGRTRHLIADPFGTIDDFLRMNPAPGRSISPYMNPGSGQRVPNRARRPRPPAGGTTPFLPGFGP